MVTRPRFEHRTTPCLVVLAAVVLVALANVPAAALAASNIGLMPNPRLGKEYQEMNLKISQVHVARSIPFLQLTPTQRMSHVNTYVNDLRGRQYGKVRSSLSADFAKGSLVSEVGAALATSILTRMAQGATMEESIEDTWNYVASSEFIFGQLICGIGGAIVGGLIPLPVVNGIAGQIVSSIPMMIGASLGGQFGYGLIEGLKQGTLDPFALLKSVDYLALVCQSVGSAIGMVYGGFLPVPALGPVIGGVIGGTIGLKVAGLLRERIRGGTAEAVVRPGETPDVPAESAGAGATTDGAAHSAADEESIGSLSPSDIEALRAQAYLTYVAAEGSGDREVARNALEVLYRIDAVLARTH